MSSLSAGTLSCLLFLFSSVPWGECVATVLT